MLNLAKMNEQKPVIKAGAAGLVGQTELVWFFNLPIILGLSFHYGNDNNFCILVLLWMKMGKMSAEVHGTKIHNKSISVYLLYYYNLLEGNVMRQTA